MKILALHSDFIQFKPVKKALPKAEDVPLDSFKRENCLVVFSAVESRDGQDVEGVVDSLVEEVKELSSKLGVSSVVLYPYAHLSSDLAEPDVALKVLSLAESKLSALFDFARAPFGWYKSFTISVKGHPLSELSRVIEPRRVSHSREYSFSLSSVSFDKKPLLSSAFLVAAALKDIFPDVEFGSFGISQDKGFLDVSVKISESVLKDIGKRVKKLINSGDKIVESKTPVGKYQTEILKDVPSAKVYSFKGVSLVSLFDIDLSGALVVRAFKPLSVSSAYWRGSAKNEQLSRIYFVAFDSVEGLKSYESLVAEAEKRDHKRLGVELDLFSFHEESPGMPFFHDNGVYVLSKLREFMVSEMSKLGYKFLQTPVILNKKLWLQSGHWDHYRENMYFTKIDDQDFAVKPMNCPGHILVYKRKNHSYRELPLKLGEFGLVHRHELSGVLSGLFRVRCFTQDDAHIFCTREQIEDEIFELLELIERVYSRFGFSYSVELSTRPEHSLGDDELWSLAESSLENALKKKGINFKVNEGDGAFYGPKIDFHVNDALGRSWQCGTIQLDFSMPERFDLSYEGSDGKKHRPVMIHRAIYGSLERFFGILIEHFAGKFPLWLSPVPVRVLTVNDSSLSFAREVADAVRKAGFRVELDGRAETIGRKVREARLARVNYVVTIGDKEVSSRTLAVRDREGNVKFNVGLDDFVSSLVEEVSD